jgi:nitrogen fixation/metabolism regulation signal transduction histidine kinase
MAPLIQRVVAAFAPERALAGVEVDCDVAERLPALRGDEQLLGIALAGLIAATHALVERTPGARVRVQAAAFRSELRVNVSQDAVSLPPASRMRFFDLGWAERPGGVGIGARLAAARRVAELHGGKVQLATTERGCTLALALPTGAGR